MENEDIILNTQELKKHWKIHSEGYSKGYTRGFQKCIDIVCLFYPKVKKDALEYIKHSVREDFQ